MPGMDKTGPLGKGPIGRGMGLCGEAGTIQQIGRRGGNRGRGYRCGNGIGWGRSLSSNAGNDEKEILEEQKSRLEKLLEGINQRLGK